MVSSCFPHFQSCLDFIYKERIISGLFHSYLHLSFSSACISSHQLGRSICLELVLIIHNRYLLCTYQGSFKKNIKLKVGSSFAAGSTSLLGGDGLIVWHPQKKCFGNFFTVLPLNRLTLCHISSVGALKIPLLFITII